MQVTVVSVGLPAWSIASELRFSWRSRCAETPAAQLGTRRRHDDRQGWRAPLTMPRDLEERFTLARPAKRPTAGDKLGEKRVDLDARRSA